MTGATLRASSREERRVMRSRSGLRYWEDPVEPGPLDRERALELLAAVRGWALGLLGPASA